MRNLVNDINVAVQYVLRMRTLEPLSRDINNTAEKRLRMRQPYL
jgi:hypothetical protein